MRYVAKVAFITAPLKWIRSQLQASVALNLFKLWDDEAIVTLQLAGAAHSTRTCKMPGVKWVA